MFKILHLRWLMGIQATTKFIAIRITHFNSREQRKMIAIKNNNVSFSLILHASNFNKLELLLARICFHRSNELTH